MTQPVTRLRTDRIELGTSPGYLYVKYRYYLAVFLEDLGNTPNAGLYMYRAHNRRWHTRSVRRNADGQIREIDAPQS